MCEHAGVHVLTNTSDKKNLSPSIHNHNNNNNNNTSI